MDYARRIVNSGYVPSLRDEQLVRKYSGRRDITKRNVGLALHNAIEDKKYANGSFYKNRIQADIDELMRIKKNIEVDYAKYPYMY